MGAGRLDVDELVRHEVSRAQDIVNLLEIHRDLAKNARKTGSTEIEAKLRNTLLECKYREQWRRSREMKNVLMKEEINGDNKKLLAKHMKACTFVKYKDQDHLADFLCLSSWGQNDATMNQLVTYGCNYISQVMSVLEARLIPDSHKKKLHTLRMPGPNECPGNIVEKKTLRRIHQLRRQYSAHIIQRATRGYLGRTLAKKVAAIQVIFRWFKFWKKRRDILIGCRKRVSARAIVRFWKFMRLRTRSTGFSGEIDPERFPERKVILIQTIVRMWGGVKQREILEWERKLADQAQLMKQWKHARESWGRNRVDLRNLCVTRLRNEKEFAEIELLKTMEMKRCNEQYRQYEKKAMQAMQRSKLPPDWVACEDEGDDNNNNGQNNNNRRRSRRNILEQALETEESGPEFDRDDDQDQRTDSDELHDKGGKSRKKQKQYLNMKTGKVTTSHPNAVKFQEIKDQERQRAEMLLQGHLEKLDHYALLLKHDEDSRKQQVAANLLQLYHACK